MPHGTPDWGLVGPKSTVYGLDDLGEHAARMGSPHLWDRRGDVVHQTDFSVGLGVWYAFWWGPPAYVCLFTEWARSGAFCVKLVTDGDVTHPVGLRAYLPMPRIAGMGLEYSFSTRSTHLYWQWLMEWHIGTDEYRGFVRWDLSNNRLEYRGADHNWHVFATDVFWEDSNYILNTGKLVVDTSLWQYARFLLNDQTYPMAGWAVEHTVVLVGNWFVLRIYLYAPNLIYAEGYVDSVIVTQNEP